MKPFSALKTLAATAVLMMAATVPLTALPGAAQAMVIKEYTYTGNPFTSIDPFDFYMLGDSISVSLTIDCGLTASPDCSSLPLTDHSAAVLDLSVVAGPDVSGPSEVGIASALFSTGPDMNVIEWRITTIGEPLIITTSGGIPGFPDGPVDLVCPGAARVAALFGSDCLTVQGNIFSAPGTWSVVTVSVPVPPSFSLFLTGLCSLFFLLSWHRRVAHRSGAVPCS